MELRELSSGIRNEKRQLTWAFSSLFPLLSWSTRVHKFIWKVFFFFSFQRKKNIIKSAKGWWVEKTIDMQQKSSRYRESVRSWRGCFVINVKSSRYHFHYALSHLSLTLRKRNSIRQDSTSSTNYANHPVLASGCECMSLEIKRRRQKEANIIRLFTLLFTQQRNHKITLSEKAKASMITISTFISFGVGDIIIFHRTGMIFNFSFFFFLHSPRILCHSTRSEYILKLLFINKLCTWHWIFTVDKKWAEVSLSGETFFYFFFIPEKWKTESMVTGFPSKPKELERMATNTKEEEEEKKNITQKLIILHYDYVVHSLTMRLSNWCQRSHSTQTANEDRRKKAK